MIIRRTLIILMVSAIMLLYVGRIGFAQSGSGYSLTWSTVNGGGGELANSGYALDGTAGQSDAHPGAAGGDYQLTSGLWAGLVINNRQKHAIFIPYVEK